MKNISTNLSTAQPGIIYILTGLLVLFLSQISFSQIIIEERVEVDPQVIVGDYPVSAFDPCVTVPTNNYEQVIYSCSSFPIEPYQQLYPFQSGTSLQLEANTSYEVEITEGTGFASFSRIAYTDSSGVFHEEEELGSYIYNLTGSELSGTGDYTGLQATGTFIRENISLYRIILITMQIMKQM